jgi:hypothetical protein
MIRLYVVIRGERVSRPRLERPPLLLTAMSIERYTPVIAGRAVIAVTVIVPEWVIPATSIATMLESTGGNAAIGAIASDNTATPARMAAGRNGIGDDRGTSLLLQQRRWRFCVTWTAS